MGTSRRIVREKPLPGKRAKPVYGGQRQSDSEFFKVLASTDDPFGGALDFGGWCGAVEPDPEPQTPNEWRLAWLQLEDEAWDESNDPYVLYPKGAEWVERLRCAGYEPRLYGGGRHDRIVIRGGNKERDKKVFAFLAPMIEANRPLYLEARGYLKATTKGFSKSGSKRRKKGKSAVSGKKRSRRKVSAKESKARAIKKSQRDMFS